MLLACALAGAAHAQEATRPRVEPALARALADAGEADAALRRQASSPRARAGELRVIAEPPRGRGADALPLAEIRALGARIDGVSRSRVRIAGSPAVLARVARIAGIGALRYPLLPVPVEGAGLHISESVGLVGATPFQTNGVTGSGVDVAVVDLGFWRLAEAIGLGEIPPDTVTYDIVGAGIEAVTSHGTAVAEQVVDMAPGVRLHVILIEDELDLELAIDYVANNGIRIANLSVNWFQTSYYDDTGPISDMINASHDVDGVFWAVGGGNWGYRHWRGAAVDVDTDRWLEFAVGDEQLGLSPETTAQVCLLLNWNQYGPDAATDLDLYVYSGGGAQLALGDARQTAGIPPAEQACWIPIPGDTPYAQVRRFSGSLAGVDLTVISSNVTIAADNRVAASSLVDPAVAHGAFAVGAVDEAVWNQPTPPIEPLSSQGPTTDGRTKPELVAPDRTDSLARPDAPGTSFASPVAAGAAALMLAQNSTLTNLQLRAGLIAAAQDVGPVVGQDDTYGWGKLVVPVVAPGPDGDTDGIQDAFDVCPFEPDPLQLDSNSDGIGNACQCGDLSGDGLITGTDVDVLRDWLTAVVPPAAALARCNVIGVAIPLGGDCRIDDRVVLERALSSEPPGVAQVCGPALP